MTSVAEALAVVLGQAHARPSEVAPLTSSTLGQVLADDLHADLDSPPFAKALMDGFAVRAADLPAGTGTLRLTAPVAAGMVAGELPAGCATPVATGAPVPAGADAVVKLELATVSGDSVTLADPQLAPGRNVFPQGHEFRQGDVVVPRGTVMTPVAFGLSAAIGRTAIPTIPPARVAVLVTGDELVEANMRPRGGQIRNSNGPMLVALTTLAGGLPRYLGIGRDDPAILRSLVREALLTADVLVMSGGVSVGPHDHTAAVLADLGATVHFHQVAMKPGKPLTFATAPAPKGPRTRLIFGLPGNPVSAALGFTMFVAPALRQIAGLTDVGPRRVRLTLLEPLTVTNDRPTFHPAALAPGGVRPLAWSGSADLRSLLNADAVIELPPGPVDWPAGATATVLPL